MTPPPRTPAGVPRDGPLERCGRHGRARAAKSPPPARSVPLNTYAGAHRAATRACARGRRQRSFLERCPRPCDAARRGVLRAPGRWWRASRAPPPVGLLARAQLTRDLAAGDRARGLLLTSDMRHEPDTLRRRCVLCSASNTRAAEWAPPTRALTRALRGGEVGCDRKCACTGGGGIARKGGVQQGVQARGAGHEAQDAFSAGVWPALRRGWADEVPRVRGRPRGAARGPGVPRTRRAA